MPVILTAENGPQLPQKARIRLDSRRGREIENEQAWELTGWDWSQVNNIERSYPGMLFLAGPCPAYNCHGLSLASRRTSPSPETTDFHKILDDDGYYQVKESEADVGDLTLYFDEETGNITHSGIVVGYKLLDSSNRRMPMIWSKWGKCREAVHSWNICPYMPARLEYYRMQSWTRNNSRTR
jgi:hypothetical protein